MSAILRCEFGRPLSSEEFDLLQFYHAYRRRNMKAVKKSIPASIETFEDFDVEADYQHWRKLVSDIFIKCLIEHDRDGIVRLADAAAFFKGKLGPKSDVSDPLRLKLLMLKYSVYEPDYVSYTIREVANYVLGADAKSEDGFSQLRRLCKELSINIKKSRKIRVK